MSSKVTPMQSALNVIQEWAEKQEDANISLLIERLRYDVSKLHPAERSFASECYNAGKRRKYNQSFEDFDTFFNQYNNEKQN